MKVRLILWNVLIGTAVIASCKKEKARPELLCGTNFSEECLRENWIINKPASASYSVLSNYEGRNVLQLINPHAPTKYNPEYVRLGGVIKNIKPNRVYQVSCDVKIKGYSDYAKNSPGFAFYAYSDETWYGALNFGSEPGVYLDQNWTTMKYKFKSGPEDVLSFELGSVYDTTWISNLVIKEL